MIEVESPQLREVSVRLKAAGLTGLRRQMNRNIRLATAPAPDRVRASALATLPRAGGLNEWVADAVIRTSITTGARTAGVSLRMRKTGHDLKSIDAGVVRHPVFGHTDRWAVTSVKPGFWTSPLMQMRPVVLAACQAAVIQASAEAGFGI